MTVFTQLETEKLKRIFSELPTKTNRHNARLWMSMTRQKKLGDAAAYWQKKNPARDPRTLHRLRKYGRVVLAAHLLAMGQKRLAAKVLNYHEYDQGKMRRRQK